MHPLPGSATASSALKASRSRGSPRGSLSIASSSAGSGRFSDATTTWRSTRPAYSSAAISANRNPYQTDDRVATIVHWTMG